MSLGFYAEISNILVVGWGGVKSIAMTKDHSPGKNWAGNYTYRAEKLHRPSTIEQVREIVANAPGVRGLGSLVTSGGEIIQASRGEPGFDGLVVELGAVTRITLDMEPA
jgi:hypothetical protein